MRESIASNRLLLFKYSTGPLSSSFLFKEAIVVLTILHSWMTKSQTVVTMCTGMGTALCTDRENVKYCASRTVFREEEGTVTIPDVCKRDSF